jgi:TatD DNase family protein
MSIFFKNADFKHKNPKTQPDMTLIDTHAHLYARQFSNDRPAMLKRARAAGVTKVYLPAIDAETHADMLALEAAEPDFCTAMMGVHPCSIKAETIDNELFTAEKYLSERPFCAIGEIGIDLYWDKTTFELQKKAFIQQMHWAQDLGLPIIIHSREATDEIIQILRENAWFTEGGILHCFTGDVAQAQQLIGMGFYLGIGGVVTYKTAESLHEVVRSITLDHLVLETDAPYLAPVPHRGKRNESSYVRFVAEKVAELKGVEVAEVGRMTSANAEKNFSKKAAFAPVIA